MYNPVSERVLAARIHSKHINVSVVVGYAPTEDSDAGVKDYFYQQLTDTFDELPGHDIKLLLGDFNARVTSDSSAWPGVLGRHSLHSSSNDNGQRLIDFCAMHGLTIGGTMFQHRDIHKGTWLSPDGRTVTQIDHICISTKWARSLLDVKSCRGADVGSDHYLVRGKLRVKFKAVEKIHTERKKIPATENLRNQSKVEEFNIALSNRFSCLPVEEDLESQWSTIKETIKEVSTEVLGERRHPDAPWFARPVQVEAPRGPRLGWRFQPADSVPSHSGRSLHDLVGVPRVDLGVHLCLDPWLALRDREERRAGRGERGGKVGPRR